MFQVVPKGRPVVPYKSLCFSIAYVTSCLVFAFFAAIVDGNHRAAAGYIQETAPATTPSTAVLPAKPLDQSKSTPTISEIHSSDEAAEDMRIDLYDGRKLEVATASLEGYKFDGMNLHRANFDSTLLNGASFSGANLRGAFLDKSEAQKVSFSTASLITAFLQHGHLNESSFRDSWLIDTSFDHADLSVADIPVLE